MNRRECFEFTAWVVENYRKFSHMGYLKKGERLTTESTLLTIEELFEHWKTNQKHTP